MKSILIVFAGFITNLFFEGFSRIVIAFFYNLRFSFWGIGALPGTGWIVVIYAVSFITSWFGCMLTMTLADYSPKKHQMAFLFLALIWSSFELLASINVVPLWYLLSFPLASLIGIATAGFTFKMNGKTN